MAFKRVGWGPVLRELGIGGVQQGLWVLVLGVRLLSPRGN